MSKCFLCSQHKGNRSCPALNADICSLCCGTKRRKTVACPEDCGYLKQGRAYQEQRAGTPESFDEVRAAFPDYVNAIDLSILAVRVSRFRDLLDRELKEALENVLKTVETAGKGLIYEYRSPDPRIQIVADAVSKVVKEFQDQRRADTEQTRACLLAAVAAIKPMIARNPESTQYLDLIGQYAHESAPEPKPSGLIQLP